MKVFYACADPGIAPGGTKGAAVHFEAFAVALADLGHEVTPFLARSGAFPLPLRHGADRDALVAAASSLGRPDLICERYSLGATGGLEASRLFGAPFVLEVNAPLFEEASRHRPHTVRPEHEEVEEHLFREADLVVAVSEPLRRYVARVRGTDDGTAVLRNGCHPVELASGPREAGLLVFLGHPKPWHGAERLVPLLHAVEGARLLVVGGGRGADAVWRTARREAMADRVEITGAVEPGEVHRHLARASIGLAPYPPQEFFYFCPLKVVEYLAAGLPVVATRQGDLPEIVGDTALLVPPEDAGALHDAVRRLLADDRLREELGRRGRRLAHERYLWEHAARRLLELAAPLVARRSVSR